MNTRTATAKGLAKPHKAEAPVKAEGSSLSNARTIATERPANKNIGRGGLPSTYYGNSRACNTAERGGKE